MITNVWNLNGSSAPFHKIFIIIILYSYFKGQSLFSLSFAKKKVNQEFDSISATS